MKNQNPTSTPSELNPWTASQTIINKQSRLIGMLAGSLTLMVLSLFVMCVWSHNQSVKLNLYEKKVKVQDSIIHEQTEIINIIR